MSAGSDATDQPALALLPATPIAILPMTDQVESPRHGMADFVEQVVYRAGRVIAEVDRVGAHPTRWFTEVI